MSIKSQPSHKKWVKLHDGGNIKLKLPKCKYFYHQMQQSFAAHFSSEQKYSFHCKPKLKFRGRGVGREVYSG